MTVLILDPARWEIDEAFDHYQSKRPGLGLSLLAELRHATDRIVEFPEAWHPMDDRHRRYRLHRFPYGVIYRLDREEGRIVVVAFMHLHRRPSVWRGRE